MTTERLSYTGAAEEGRWHLIDEPPFMGKRAWTRATADPAFDFPNVIEAMRLCAYLNALERDRAELVTALEKIVLMANDMAYTATYDLALDVYTEAKAVLARIRSGAEATK